MSVPRLHVVTDDDVLADARFADVAGSLLDAHGAIVALHLRGAATATRRLHELAYALVPRARAAGAVLLVNDRIDVALVTDADGVHLGRRSMPPADARSIVGDRTIGASVHSAEAAHAVSRWTDFLLLGTIYPTESHPGAPGAGPALVAETVAASDRPVLGIGGITLERVHDVLAAGGHGVAVLRGVWAARDPVAAAGRYAEALSGGERAAASARRNEVRTREAGSGKRGRRGERGGERDHDHGER